MVHAAISSCKWYVLNPAAVSFVLDVLSVLRI
jgi:hypothetical protein